MAASVQKKMNVLCDIRQKTMFRAFRGSLPKAVLTFCDRTTFPSWRASDFKNFFFQKAAAAKSFQKGEVFSSGLRLFFVKKGDKDGVAAFLFLDRRSKASKRLKATFVKDEIFIWSNLRDIVRPHSCRKSTIYYKLLSLHESYYYEDRS